MITPELRIESLNSHWLKKDAWDSFGFTSSTPVHVIFEAVLLNISTNNGIHWKKIWNEKDALSETYKLLVISVISINHILKYKVSIGEESRKNILGDEKWEIVADFWQL